jgi:trehalose-phosphatase
VPGAQVECKRLTLSVHWRRVAPARVALLRRRAAGVLRPWEARGRIRLTRGKRVLEVRPPAAWDKGAAVSWLLRKQRGPVTAWYVGDDRTDESAFQAVNRLGGASVFVGPPAAATAARWRLRGPGEVGTLLHRLAEEREKGHREDHG